MIGIDTNVLVRFLTQDDEVQSMKATKLINYNIGKKSSIFINNIVMCELIWVLKRGYKYSKKEIIAVLNEILSTIEFSFENHKLFWIVANEYSKANADFSDILIGRQNILYNCTHSYTFEAKAAALPIYNYIN